MDYKAYSRLAMKGAELSDGSMLAVKITAGQATSLLSELDAADELRFSLWEGNVLGGTIEELGRIAYRLENLATIAAAVGQDKRERVMRGVLKRLSAAGVQSSGPLLGQSGSIPQADHRRVSLIGIAPERVIAAPMRKSIHPRKLERVNRELEDFGLPRGFEAVVLRKGRAQGRSAGKRAFASKSRPKAAVKVGVRGDRVFRRGLPEHTAEGPLNDDRVARLIAGTQPGDRSESRDRTRAGQRALAQRGVRDSLDVRIARAVPVVLRKRGRVNASSVADELCREDIRAGKYAFGSGRALYMHRRYVAAGQRRDVASSVAPSSTPKPSGVMLAGRGQRVVAKKRRSKRAIKARPREVVVRVAARRECEHAWVVTPKRVKRSCECCGAVERKVRGRWVRQAKAVAAVPAPRISFEEHVKRMMSITACSRSEAERRVREYRKLMRAIA